MDTSPSRQSKNISPNSHLTEYEYLKQENMQKQKDYTRNVRFKKSRPRDEDIANNTKFQIPESDNINYLQDSSHIGKPRKHRKDKLYTEDPFFKDSSVTPLQSKDVSSGFPETSYKYYPRRNNMMDSERNAPFSNSHYDQSTGTYLKPITQTRTNDYNEMNRAGNATNPELNINSSLICRPVNIEGEPVKVNDEIVRDKLILSCRPKKYYKVGSYIAKPLSMDPNYIQPASKISVVQSVDGKKKTDLELGSKEQEQLAIPSITTGRPLIRRDAIDRTLGMGEPAQDEHRKGEKYGEQYRAIQCKRYKKNFKVFLWALFFINTLLVLVGLALLLITLSHILFYDYMNIVLSHRGFVMWMWLALGLSLLIIFVGSYGIITSISRSKKMLFTYCVMAAALALLIFIFLLLFWIMSNNLKSIQAQSMQRTFNLYRCNRWIRFGWDTMQENHQCCGVEARGDWKYIPPSCCHAETSIQKAACINHFIQEELAFKGGCRIVVEDYFITKFLLITCLLVLAIILLLLGILAALRLLKMYKIILLCRDMYLITTN